jgi:glycosyltransferase involved in cell wall biosynthesis
MSSSALLLTPSRGLGGGIERYVETLEWAFSRQGVEYCRLDLSGSGPGAHARLLVESQDRLRQHEGMDRLVVAHRALLPVATLLAGRRPGHGISVVCHGSDVWGSRLSARRMLENHLMRQPRVRVVAVSSFTAGVLADRCPATVLPPGLSRPWFDTLVGASATARPAASQVTLVTAFRLADWQDKGLPQLLQAIAGLGRPDIRLTVCGTGEPSTELWRLVSRYDFCVLRSGLTNDELAARLAAADLFVLATRTRLGHSSCGEGFGMVLLEAQVAGTAVIGPAHGGCHDAYLDGVTGVAPTDESAEALRTTLDKLLRCPDRIAQMSGHAASWARRCFAPDHYAALAVARLL